MLKRHLQGRPRALLIGVALILLCLVSYWGVRFHHIENQLYLMLVTGSESESEPISSGVSRLGDYKMDVAALQLEGIDGNLSGLAFDYDRLELIAVVNRPPMLLTLDLSGRLLTKRVLRSMADTEGVAYVGDGMVVILEESRSRVVLMALNSHSPHEALDAVTAPSLLLGEGEFAPLALASGWSKNNGLEGVAYDVSRDALYFVKERSPKALYRVSGWVRRALGRDRDDTAMTFEDLTFSHLLSLRATDLASVEFDASTGNLLILSDESQLLAELNPKGDQVGSLSLNARFGSNGAVPQAEGVAIAPDGTIFMVSEPNLFYRARPRKPDVAP